MNKKVLLMILDGWGIARNSVTRRTGEVTSSGGVSSCKHRARIYPKSKHQDGAEVIHVGVGGASDHQVPHRLKETVGIVSV